MFPPALFELEEDEPPGAGPRWLRTIALIVGGAAVLAAAVYAAWWLLGQPPAHAPAHTPPAAPAAVPSDPVQRALKAYQLRSSLFATRRMTCEDLGRGLVELDAQWVQYNLARRRAGLRADSAPESADQALARAVSQAEDDFERTGCPRP